MKACDNLNDNSSIKEGFYL